VLNRDQYTLNPSSLSELSVHCIPTEYTFVSVNTSPLGDKGIVSTLDELLLDELTDEMLDELLLNEFVDDSLDEASELLDEFVDEILDEFVDVSLDELIISLLSVKSGVKMSWEQLKIANINSIMNAVLFKNFIFSPFLIKIFIFSPFYN
jgi:hypothetical protein